MKNIFQIIFIAIFATVSFSTLAADWTVIQSATITTDAPELKQGAGRVLNSVQAINGIALETDADDLTRGSSQLATLTSRISLNLTQGLVVAGSSQAINYLEARNVGTNSGVAVTQTVTSDSAVTTLTQKVSGTHAGTENAQAMNIGKSSDTGTIHNLNQVITEGGTLSLIQNDVETAENVQAVNYAFGQTIGGTGAGAELEQATTVTGATAFSQAAQGGKNRQGGNIAVTSSSGGASGGVIAASQAFTATVEIGLTQNMATGHDENVQALNQVDTTDNSAGIVGTVSQTFTNTGGAGTTFTSNAASEKNVQAANLVDTHGNIADLTQTFTATNSALVLFDMTGSGNTNIQAGNMAITDGTSVIAEITQTFNGANNSSATANTFNQISTGSNLVQSGNLIALGTGSISDDLTSPHQVFIAGIGSIAMTQEGVGTDNLQSLNAITGAGSTLPTQAYQTISTTGAFTMSQNAMTGSRQFGSFAGEM